MIDYPKTFPSTLIVFKEGNNNIDWLYKKTEPIKPKRRAKQLEFEFVEREIDFDEIPF